MNVRRTAGVCVLVLLAAKVYAAGVLWESPEAVMQSRRNNARQIALATLHGVRQLSPAEVNGFGMPSDQPAFAVRVEFREILRGVAPEKPLAFPLAFIPISEDPLHPKTNQQREADLEGHRAVAIVLPEDARGRPIVIVWPVSSFETDDRVKFWRQATDLWNTADPQQRRAALLAGCRDPLPEFQDYCCRRLANWSGGKPDQNAAEQLEPLTALPVIFKQFLDAGTPQEVLASCDEILGRTSPGWRTHPQRYDVLAAALRRHSELAAPAVNFDFSVDSQVDFNRFDQKLSALSHFPGRERQTYQIFAEIVRRAPPRYAPITLIRLASLYRQHSLDADQQRLNQEIWDRLEAALANPDSAQSASHAIYDIARDYAYVGSLPAHVSKVLAARHEELPASIAFSINNSFDRLRKELPTIMLAAPLVERLRKEGYENLTVPTRSQLGKQVVFVALPGHSSSDPVYGDPAWSSWSSWYDAPVWIEMPPDWPRGGDGRVVVTGTLAERHDVPVFELDTDLDAPFKAGLPVPAGYDVADIRRRYVVTDVSWQLVNAPQARQMD